jgi:hypothetical protein
MRLSVTVLCFEPKVASKKLLNTALRVAKKRTQLRRTSIVTYNQYQIIIFIGILLL